MAESGAMEKTSFEIDQMAQAAFDRLKQMAGILEKEEDIIQQCGGLRLRIYEEGEYPSKTVPGEMVSYPAGIELRCGGLRLNCESSDLAMLVYHLKSNPDVRKELRTRLEEEQKIMKQLSY